MDNASQDLALFPQWKQAVKDFLVEFAYGELVPLDWLDKRFGVQAISPTERLTAKQHRDRQFEFLANFESFRSELLEEHQVFLQNVRGEGYRWVHPSEQTRIAMASLAKDVRRVFRTGAKSIKHLRIAELSDDQRRENVDAQNKLASLRGMARKALK